MNENQADTIGRVVEQRTYRVEVRVPRVAREGTTWRSLSPPTTFQNASDTGAHLFDAMVAFGFDRDQVKAFFGSHVRSVEYKIETRRIRELPMTGRS